MPSAWRRIRARIWRDRYDAVAIARVRIAFAAVVLYDLCEGLRDFYTFYTDRGLLTAADNLRHGLTFSNWSILTLVTSPAGVGVVWAIAILAFVALAAGFYTRLANFVGWVLLVSIQQHLTPILDGADLVLRVVCFWLLFVDSGAALSLDVRLGRRAPSPSVPAFPVRLVQLQVAVIYLVTGAYKLNDVWLSGVAMVRVLHMHEFVRAWSACLLAWPRLCAATSYVVPLYELAIGVLLLTPWRRSRRVGLIAAYALHLGILVVLRVGLFSPVMMAVLLVFIDRPVAAAAVEEAPPRWRQAAWAVAGTLMAFVLVTEALAYIAPDLPPQILIAPQSTLSILQSWAMFERPWATDYEWHGRGVLVDGRSVDLDGAFPEIFGSPPSFTYARWLKLRGNMSKRGVRTVVTRYVCRRYNASARVPLRGFDLLVVTRDTITRVPTPASPELVLHQDCADAGGSAAATARHDGDGARSR